MPWLLLLFLAIPLIEVYFLVQVGGIIGAWPTVLLVILTAVIGAAMLRIQGFYTLRRVREQLAQGQIPAMEVFEGVILLIAGALLLTPGFFTDAVGFICLVPATRRWIVAFVLRHMTVFASRPDAGSQGGRKPSNHQTRRDSPRILEGEYHRDDN